MCGGGRRGGEGRGLQERWGREANPSQGTAALVCFSDANAVFWNILKEERELSTLSPYRLCRLVTGHSACTNDAIQNCALLCSLRVFPILNRFPVWPWALYLTFLCCDFLLVITRTIVLYVEDLRCMKSSYEQCLTRSIQTESRLLDARGLGEGAQALTDGYWVLWGSMETF